MLRSTEDDNKKEVDGETKQVVVDGEAEEAAEVDSETKEVVVDGAAEEAAERVPNLIKQISLIILAELPNSILCFPLFFLFFFNFFNFIFCFFFLLNKLPNKMHGFRQRYEEYKLRKFEKFVFF